MRSRFKHVVTLFVSMVIFAPLSFGKPVTYIIDSSHTFPAFEADHMGGLSIWRGKINSTSGEIILDKRNQSGSVNVVMEMNSIDFGHDEMNKHAKGDDMFDIEKYPQAMYEGALINFQDGAPTKIEGELTLAPWEDRVGCYNMSKRNNIKERSLNKALQSHSEYFLKFKCAEKYSALYPNKICFEHSPRW